MSYILIFFLLLLFLVFYTFLGYGILIALLVKIKELIRPPLEATYDELPEVTLLIVAYNEQDIVKHKMDNTNLLDYPSDKLKIVWITDGSTDSTVTLLQSYGNVRVLHQPLRKGKTAALNRAIDFIESSLVVFTDANTMINKEAIRAIAHQFANPRVGCVAGEKRVISYSTDSASSSGEGFYWKYESKLKDWDSRLYSVVGAAGELFAIRRHLFEVMPEDTLLDDFTLSLRIAKLGYKVSYCPNAFAMEEGSANMQEEQKRKVRIAAGGLQAVWRMRDLLNVFKYGMLSFQYISHRVLRWTLAPLALLLLIPFNLVLCLQSYNTIYLVMFVLQCLFYLLALCGYIYEKKHIRVKLLFVPYYFVFMNICVFKGLFYLRKKGKGGAWEKAIRKSVNVSSQ